MKKIILSLAFITGGCGYSLSATDNYVEYTALLTQVDSIPSVSEQNDTLKIKYIPQKKQMSPDTLQLQKEWMEKWETAVKKNNQKEAIEALEKAAHYNNGEACYKLGEIYKSGKDAKKDQVKSDSLFFYSAVYGYKPGIEWLNSGEGVFMPGGEISMPQFPGGDEALRKYIYDKTGETFDDGSGSLGFQGRFAVMVIIEKDGSTKFAKVIKKPHYEYIEKGLSNMFKNMPKWKPATWQGQPVRSFMICPFIIKLMM